MYGLFDISTSALVAQRSRLDALSANIANAKTIQNADGEYAPWQRRIPVLASGDPTSGSPLGVHIAAIELDTAAPVPVYDPTNKFADARGYVGYPNVSIVVESMNAMEAARAYEANIAAVETTKSMISAAFALLA